MQSEYKVSSMTRIQNRRLGSPTRTIHAVISDYDSYEKILRDGRIQMGFKSIKVRPWNFRKTTNQCFKCCGFGHTKFECKSPVNKCLRCSKDHRYTDCPMDQSKTPYKCANCDGDHPAVSQSCPRLLEHTTKMAKSSDTKTKVPYGFTRVNSAVCTLKHCW